MQLHAAVTQVRLKRMQASFTRSLRTTAMVMLQTIYPALVPQKLPNTSSGLRRNMKRRQRASSARATMFTPSERNTVRTFAAHMTRFTTTTSTSIRLRPATARALWRHTATRRTLPTERRLAAVWRMQAAMWTVMRLPTRTAKRRRFLPRAMRTFSTITTPSAVARTNGQAARRRLYHRI